jgi:hypothetical protein
MLVLIFVNTDINSSHLAESSWLFILSADLRSRFFIGGSRRLNLRCFGLLTAVGWGLVVGVAAVGAVVAVRGAVEVVQLLVGVSLAFVACLSVPVVGS